MGTRIGTVTSASVIKTKRPAKGIQNRTYSMKLEDPNILALPYDLSRFRSLMEQRNLTASRIEYIEEYWKFTRKAMLRQRVTIEAAKAHYMLHVASLAPRTPRMKLEEYLDQVRNGVYVPGPSMTYALIEFTVLCYTANDDLSDKWITMKDLYEQCEELKPGVTIESLIKWFQRWTGRATYMLDTTYDRDQDMVHCINHLQRLAVLCERDTGDHGGEAIKHVRALMVNKNVQEAAKEAYAKTLEWEAVYKAHAEYFDLRFVIAEFQEADFME